MKKKRSSIEELARELVRTEGKVRSRKLLEELLSTTKEEVLTIVANQSLHSIPEKYLRGTIYVASRGTLNLSDASQAEAAYRQILKKLVKMLNSRTWASIYLIPTGHPTLSAAIKLAVYQVTRRNTTDVFYANGIYFDLKVSVREGVL